MVSLLFEYVSFRLLNPRNLPQHLCELQPKRVSEANGEPCKRHAANEADHKHGWTWPEYKDPTKDARSNPNEGSAKEADSRIQSVPRSLMIHASYYRRGSGKSSHSVADPCSRSN
jgi:hypothetical protein